MEYRFLYVDGNETNISIGSIDAIRDKDIRIPYMQQDTIEVEGNTINKDEYPHAYDCWFVIDGDRKFSYKTRINYDNEWNWFVYNNSDDDAQFTFWIEDDDTNWDSFTATVKARQLAVLHHNSQQYGFDYLTKSPIVVKHKVTIGSADISMLTRIGIDENLDNNNTTLTINA